MMRALEKIFSMWLRLTCTHTAWAYYYNTELKCVSNGDYEPIERNVRQCLRCGKVERI